MFFIIKNRLLLPGNCYHLEITICSSLSRKVYALLAFHIFRTAYLFFTIKDRLCLPDISSGRQHRVIVLYRKLYLSAFVIFRTANLFFIIKGRLCLLGILFPRHRKIHENCSSSSRIDRAFLAVVIIWNF